MHNSSSEDYEAKDDSVLRTSSSLIYVPKAHKLSLIYKARIEEKKASMASIASIASMTSMPSTTSMVSTISTEFFILRPTSKNYNNPCFETPIMPIPTQNNIILYNKI